MPRWWWRLCASAVVLGALSSIGSLVLMTSIPAFFVIIPFWTLCANL